MKDLAGRVAVVTGAASGIGRALAERFARESMSVVLADVETASLRVTANELSAAGHDVLAVPTDVSDFASVQALADVCLERFGAIHLLCNNAGVGAGGPLEEIPLEDWRWVFDVNLFGVVHGVKAFLPLMRRHGDPAHIVNTASLAGLFSGAGSAPYYASKFGVVALSESLFYELAASPVGVSVLCPGYVATRFMDADRNRPGGPRKRSTTAEARAHREAARQKLAGGAPPAAIAEQVLEAVRSERFWILPHPEHDAIISERAQGIVARRNPVAPSF